MKFHCSSHEDFSKAQRIATYFSSKLLKKYKKVDGENLEVWVKQVNPEHSAGIEEFKCVVELKTNGRKYFVESHGDKLTKVIKHPFRVISNKLQKSEYINHKDLRKFKREYISKKELNNAEKARNEST
ncbi:MAG: hypothetical protein H6620_05495 [Halobacteriovoraceae bacterium]|nr:hypothetical protein [Halobacteriovoraceae bacterium]